MAPLVDTVEIDRTPEDVFAYVTDPTRFTEWQDSVVSASIPDNEPMHAGSKFEMTRKMGSREQTMTSEITDYVPRAATHSSSTALSELTANDASSRSTTAPARDSRSSSTSRATGSALVLVPLVVRRNAAKELPATHAKLKERLEAHQV